MFYPELPTKDIDFEENSSLEKLVKARLVDTVAEPGFDFGTTDYHLLDGKKSKEVGIPGAVNLYEIDEESEYEVLATYKNTPCIFKQNVHNGEVIVMGVLPYLSTDLTREFFDEIFSSVSGKNSRSLDGILSVVSRENEQGEQLILAANNRGNKSSTKLEIEMNNDKFIFPMNSELDIKPKESRLLWANLDLGYVRMIYSTTELIPLDEDYKEFKSRAAVASTGEFAFDKKLRILIDGEEIAPIQNKGLWIYTYEHQKESYRLEIE